MPGGRRGHGHGRSVRMRQSPRRAVRLSVTVSLVRRLGRACCERIICPQGLSAVIHAPHKPACSSLTVSSWDGHPTPSCGDNDSLRTGRACGFPNPTKRSREPSLRAKLPRAVPGVNKEQHRKDFTVYRRSGSRTSGNGSVLKTAGAWRVSPVWMQTGAPFLVQLSSLAAGRSARPHTDNIHTHRCRWCGRMWLPLTVDSF